ncbi:cell division protein ZapA [Kordiimonas aquimaris]|uniref:cell division protein ZapA n=1 Tax=Kordiimonas aquimaris TaxID=707591 RepID=UPI0021D27DE8|nr:cell division protein ZapA [Kordiimonas aquimaris]
MAQINVTVAGKSYPLACADGDEDRLHSLAAYIDSKTADLTEKLGHVNETRLILMAAVLIADELHDTLEGKGHEGLIGALSEDDLASMLNEVASEVETIADQLKTA